MEKIKYLTLPGLNGSGEQHWQSIWESKLDGIERVIQADWTKPNKDDWLKNLSEKIDALTEPTILIAHSLAVSLVAHWLEDNCSDYIVGAMLVAPADVDSPKHTPDILREFSPIPTKKISVPTVVVASENDPYMEKNRAQELARYWGSDFVCIGEVGHINDQSNLGTWAEGLKILKNLELKVNQ